MTTKTWKVTLFLKLDEDSHPRKFVPDAIYECLNKDEDIIEYSFSCEDEVNDET